MDEPSPACRSAHANVSVSCIGDMPNALGPRVAATSGSLKETINVSHLLSITSGNRCFHSRWLQSGEEDMNWGHGLTLSERRVFARHHFLRYDARNSSDGPWLHCTRTSCPPYTTMWYGGRRRSLSGGGRDVTLGM